jgi:hypothetical protein
VADETSQFSASEPALGYVYQIRYALLEILRQPEESVCYIEKDDDVDFSDPEEGRILASLKHKASGDTLTDLSPDFWKSVRIWLTDYLKNPDSTIPARYYLVTTGQVQIGSLLASFLPNAQTPDDLPLLIDVTLASSTSKTIKKTRDLLVTLPREKWASFFRRITIFDHQQRINEIPRRIIEDKFRSVRPKFRQSVYQRLEGWWVNECIELLTHRRKEAFRGAEVSEMLSFFSEQFRDDNLPIDFEKAEPEGGVHPDSDNRYFVKQLRAIGLKSERITRAILDYYRASEQRSSWLRENVTLDGEVEQYDDRLVDEWARIREITFEDLGEDAPEEILQQLGKKLLTDLSTRDHPNLRIRKDVTASFVTMGSYHILANDELPRVHWHPRFTERIAEILHGGKV